MEVRCSGRWVQWKCGVVEVGSVEVWCSGGGLSGSVV